MDARTISFWGCETNPYANPDTANNGGGYSQPSGGILVALENGEFLTVTVDDSLAAILAAESGLGYRQFRRTQMGQAVTGHHGRCHGGQ